MEDEESHSLSQETECSGDMFFLIMKNIPSNAGREIIEIYVENVTDDENMKLEIEFNDTGDQALLSFQQCESGPAEVMEKLKLKSTELLKCKLEVDIPPPIKNRLLVRNIRPDADEMMVVLHFESAKFNPNGNIEVEVDFSAPQKAAIVILPDSADVSTFVSGGADHSFLGPEVTVEKCNFFTCLGSIESASGTRGGKQNRGKSDREEKPKRNRGPRKKRDHNFSDNSSDQGTTERVEQEKDQSGRFQGRGRGDEDAQGGLDNIQRSNQRSASVQRQLLLDDLHNQRTDWNENNGNTIEGRLKKDTFNQVYEPDLTQNQMPHSGRQNLQYRRSGSIPNLTNLPLSTFRDDCCFMDLGGEKGRRSDFRRDFNQGSREDFYWGIQGDFNQGTKSEFNRENRGGFSQGPRDNFERGTRDFNRGTRTDSNLETRGDFNQGTRRDFDRGTRDFNQGIRTDFNQGTKTDSNQGNRGGFIQGTRVDFSRGNRGVNRGTRGSSYRGSRNFNQGSRGDFNQGTSRDLDRGTRGERQLPGSDAAEEEPMTETKCIYIKNEVQHEKCKLLFQSTGEISRKYGCMIHVDKAKHAVNISGRDEICVTQTALLVHEKLSSMYSMKVSIGQRLAESLCCIKGYQWIEDVLMKNKFMASYYLNRNKEPEILAENAESAKAIVMMLQKQVESYRIPYNSSQKAHLQSEDWKKFVKFAEGNWLVTIDVRDNEVCLEGVHPDFSLALKSIQYELTDNSRVTEAISMVFSKFRYLKTHHPDISKTTKASLKYKMAEGVLEISGTPDALERAKSFVEKTSRQLVQDDLVIAEPGVHECMLKEKGSIAKAFLESLEKNYECVIETTTLKDPSVAMSSMQSVARRSQVNFSICSKNLPNVKSVKEELKKLVKMLVFTSSIKFRMDLTPPQVKSILQLQSKSLDVKIDDALKVILLAGSQETVEKSQSKVLNLLEDFKTEESDLVKNTKEENECMTTFETTDVAAPEHWQHYKGSLGNISEYEGHLVEVSQSTFDAVSQLVSKTWQESLVGLGVDALNLHHHKIQVRKVFHVENVALYKRYATKLKEFCLQKSGEAIPPLQDLQLHGERDVETLGVPHLDALTMSEVKECFLFYGMENSQKDAILNQGFDALLGNQSVLYGRGIYFSESATKADQYADPKASRVGAGVHLCMIVARVLLGRAYICNKPKQFRRPPCTDLQCSSDTCAEHPLYDSVIGTHNFLPNPAAPSEVPAAMNLYHQATGSSLFREFVVYDQSQCYPEFLVEYVRMKN